MTPSTLKLSLEQARYQAREACQTHGSDAQACAAQWDIVEELQAALAHKRTQPAQNFAHYCEQHPEALECRMYDV